MKEKQIFIKDLSNEEKKEILDFILEKFQFNDKEQATIFYNNIVRYISTLRRKVDTFKKNVDEILEMLKKLDFSNDEIIIMLSKEPSLLHSNKDEMFYRMLIFGKIIPDWEKRKELIVHKPQNLRTSEKTTYARVKYLTSDNGLQFRRKTGNLTARQLVKISHDEFEDFYKISKEKLLKSYEFNNAALLDIISWPENKEILDKVYNNGRSI